MIERPPYDTAAPADTMGLGHIRVALSDLEFPLTRRDLVERYGKWRIPITGTHFEPLSEFLDGVREERFARVEDVVGAIARAHPELR